MNTNRLHSNLLTLLDSADTVLLLQGPLGRFFCDLADWLARQGKRVFKINFNAGDELYYSPARADTFAYRDTTQAFAEFLHQLVEQQHIGAIVCFGDTRPYHQIAKTYTQQHAHVDFWVFEEGYFRPHFVTLERCGVNAYSSLPRQGDFFRQAFTHLAEQDYREPKIVPAGWWPPAKVAIPYYICTYWRRHRFPHYVHHRSLRLQHYVGHWLRSGLRRAYLRLPEKIFDRKVAQGHLGRFYIVPLQVFNDSQVRVHSDFSSVQNFLLHVLTSFATHAPADTKIVVKHHPMDRGYISYRKYINRFIRQHPHCRGRIFYVHDVSLPGLLRHGAGMVTLNSTSGLSALIHQMPVKVLGRAHYDIPGMTDQGSLSRFWRQPQAPDADLFHAYRQYHINLTQINGNFYSRVLLPEWLAIKPITQAVGHKMSGRVLNFSVSPKKQAEHSSKP